MAANKYKMIAFDLDGTLIDSMGDFARTAAAVLGRHFGMDEEAALAAYRATSGLPFRFQLDKIFPDGDAARLDAAAADYESEKLAAYARKDFFQDVPAALSRLKAAGYLLCVSSNNHAENVAAKMRTSAGEFDEILGYRPGFFKGADHFRYLNEKYGMSPRDMLFVGDSLNDARVAAANGVGFIARVGTFSRQEFDGAYPGVTTVERFEELCRLLGA